MTSAFDDCSRATGEELEIEPRDIREIGERIKEQKAKGGDLRAFAKTQAEKTRIAAALQRKQAALNVLRRQEWERDFDLMRKAGMSVADMFLAKTVGVSGDKALSRGASASYKRAVLEEDYVRGMAREIDVEVPGAMRVLKTPGRSKALAGDISREWHKTGSTGNEMARKIADIMGRHAEKWRLEANKAGANIGRLDDWGGPQSHDDRKLLKAGQDEWLKDISGWLNLDRTYDGLTGAERAERLRQTWDNIVLGRTREVTAKEKGERVGPANLARSLEKERTLHFKDAEARIAYNEKYGDGNVLTAVTDHARRMARATANMQVMGPNPEVFVDAMLESERRAIHAKGGSAKNQKALQSINADLRTGTGAVGGAFWQVMGYTNRPHDVTLANRAANVRAVITMAKLGGSVLSSFSDLAVMAHRLSYQGENLFVAQGRALHALFSGRPKKEGRDLAELLSVGFDHGLGDIHSRFDAGDSVTGKMAQWQNTFFKITGQEWWTNHLTGQFAAMASFDMAKHARGAWDTLPPAYQRVLGLHRIDAHRWEQVRKLVGKADDGRAYVFPHLAADRELELDMKGFFIDESRYAVLQGDDRTRMFSTLGTQKGTLRGEAFRFLMQFKGYPIAYLTKVLMPAVKRGGQEPLALASLIAMSTVYGFLSGAVKDITKNRTPKDPAKLDTWLAAFVQGGGLGLYGDFLIAKRDRFGSGIAGDLIGPGFGALVSAAELAQDVKVGEAKPGEALNLVLANTPFANLWFARAALDMAVLNQFQELLAPGRTARMNKRLAKDFGQRPLVDQMLLSDRF